MRETRMVTEPNAVAFQMAKDELSAAIKNLSSGAYRNRSQKVVRAVNAAIASMNSFSNGTSTVQETTNALNSAINECDSATRSLNINGPDSGFVRGVLRIKSILQKAKGTVSNIKHSAFEESTTDMVMDLFFLEHGDDKVSNYIEI